MIRFAVPLIAVVLVGCAPSAAAPKPMPAAPTPCGAEKLGGFIGKQRTDAISKQVAEKSGAKGIRWISPGMAVTMDYREDRLNVFVSDKGVIQRVSCG